MIIISPGERIEEIVERDCSFDLVDWALNDYAVPLSEYRCDRPVRLRFYVRNIREHDQFYSRTKAWEPVERFEYYWTVMVSSNMRRFVTYAKESIAELDAHDRVDLANHRVDRVPADAVLDERLTGLS